MYNHRHLIIIFLILFEFCENHEECFIQDTCFNQSSSTISIYNEEVIIQNRNCFCDSFCDEYGDCCHSTQSILDRDNYQCIDYLTPTLDDRIPPFSPIMVWMKTRCLPIYIGTHADRLCQNTMNKTLVEDPTVYVPVTSLQTNITYRNYYCAYCNNDHRGSLEFWEYKTFCQGQGNDRDYLTLFNNEQVEYYVHNLTRNCRKTILYPHERGKSYPSVFIRPCKNALRDECPPGTPEDLSSKCRLSPTAYRYVLNSTVIYRNQYCAKCQEKNLNSLTCFDPILRAPFAPLNHLRIHPLSILFDPNLLKRYLNNNTNPRQIYSREYRCNRSDELYNIIEQKCTRISDSSQDLILSMNCSLALQTLLKSEDKLFYENRTLYLHDKSIFLLKEEYVFIGENQILFCFDRWTNQTETSIESNIVLPFYRHVLSIICTTISLVSLLFFIIAFCFTSSLQNLPGRCLFFLSICLFLGQLLLLISDSISTGSIGCLITAILIHFFYLSSFVWLLLISIQIHSTFTHQTFQREVDDKKCHLLMIYNVFVWSSAGILTLIGCLIQFIRPRSSFSPSYGLIYCSISKVNAMIIFFLVPIGCILLLIIFFFVKTLFAIQRSRSIAKLANSTTSSNMNSVRIILIYSRLASLMGIQWILLIFALIIRQEWIWIIFEIVNSVPGVFICLGFLCSKRLFESIRQQLSMKFLTRQQSSKSNLTHSTSLSPSLILMESMKPPNIS